MRPYSTSPRPIWKQYLLDGRLPAFLVTAVALAVAIILGRFVERPSEGGIFECAPDGTLTLPDQKIRPMWDSRFFFSITLAWGDFSLSTVKLIDVCWDLVIGRGGQLLLSSLVFWTIRRSILTSLERNSWRMPVLTRQMLDPVSLSGLRAAVKEAASDHGSAGISFYGLAIAYVLCFNIIVSAMTGYRTSMAPVLFRDNGSTVALNNLTRITPWALGNSTRGCPGGLEVGNACISDAFDGCVITPGEGCDFPWQRYKDLTSNCASKATASRESSDTYQRMPNGTCRNKHASVDWTYERRYGLFSSSDKFEMTTSTLSIDNQTVRIDAPPLTVTTWGSSRYAGNDTMPRYYDDPGSGKVVNSTWIRSATICQPAKTYQWGFSALMLFSFSILTIVYGLVMIQLNFYIWRRTSINKRDLHFSVYRDILDLAAEIKAELGGGVEDLSAKDLDKCMNISATLGQSQVRLEDRQCLPSEENDNLTRTSTSHERKQSSALSISERAKRWMAGDRQICSRSQDRGLVEGVDVETPR